MKKIGQILLLLLMPAAFAIAQTSIYSEIVLDGDTIIADGREFTFTFDYGSRQAMVQSELGSYFIPEEECKNKNNINICIGEFAWSHRNATTLLDIYESEVNIYKVTADLELTHEVKPEQIRIGEQAKGVVIIENQGDIAAENLALKISVPKQLSVISVVGCSVADGMIELKTILGPKKKIQCSFDVQGISSAGMDVLANVSFFDGIEKTTLLEEAAIEVLSPSLNITAPKNLSGQTLDMIPVTIGLENRDEDLELKITKLSIAIPGAFSVAKKPDLSYAQNKLSWSGTLKPQERVNLTFELRARESGTYAFLIDAAYSENNFVRKTAIEFPADIHCDCPIIEQSGNQILLVNQNPAQTFRDISAVVDGVEKKYSSLAPESHLVLGSNAQNVRVQFVSETNERFTLTNKAPLEPIVQKQEQANQTPVEAAHNRTSNQDSEKAAPSPVERNISSNTTKVREVITELQKPISGKAILIGGAIAGAAFLITTLFLLRKRKSVKVKGKTLEDIEQELSKMDSERK